MYRHISVPLDGSTFAASALPLAIGLAEKTRAVLHLVHVAESKDDVAAMRAHLAELKAGAESRVPGGVQAAIVMGEVAMAIATYADEHEVDVVVLATHGRGGVSRAWLGSVAEILISTLPMPVLRQRPLRRPRCRYHAHCPRRCSCPWSAVGRRQRSCRTRSCWPRSSVPS